MTGTRDVGDVGDVGDVATGADRADGWWINSLGYEVYIRSFADSDGDGVGDLAGVAGRLDYLADLGVDFVWITPFYPSPMADWGYDVADYCGVDRRFGSLDDFDALLDAAHALADRLAANAPLAARATKEVAARTADMGWTEAVRFGETMRLIAGSTDDAAEGRRAWAEKRRPEWRGR